MNPKEEDMIYRTIKKMNRYWVSWWSKNTAKDTPFDFWCTGERGDEGDKSYCAVIDAPNKNLIRITLRKYFPNYEERFIDEREATFVPGDRFPSFVGKTDFK